MPHCPHTHDVALPLPRTTATPRPSVHYPATKAQQHPHFHMHGVALPHDQHGHATVDAGLVRHLDPARKHNTHTATVTGHAHGCVGKVGSSRLRFPRRVAPSRVGRAQRPRPRALRSSTVGPMPSSALGPTSSCRHPLCLASQSHRHRGTLVLSQAR
jgi:hypothetical protein